MASLWRGIVPKCDVWRTCVASDENDAFAALYLSDGCDGVRLVACVKGL